MPANTPKNRLVLGQPAPIPKSGLSHVAVDPWPSINVLLKPSGVASNRVSARGYSI
jgi:hypothetical protein